MPNYGYSCPDNNKIYSKKAEPSGGVRPSGIRSASYEAGHDDCGILLRFRFIWSLSREVVRVMEMSLVDTGLEERIRAGREAVMGQVEYFHQNLGRVESDWKHDATRVTAVDLVVAEKIFRGLHDRFPSDDLFSEEMDPGQGVLPRSGEFSWILDPVDGTNNYALGVPFCSIALALLRDGQPVYGFIYDGSRRRLIEGGAGYPLRDGDQTRRANSAAPSRKSFVAVHTPHVSGQSALLHPIIEHFKIRALGSSALHLAYVANGLLDGMVDVNVRVWDIAAACALCEAGGAEVRFLNGEVFPLDRFDLHMPPLHVCAGNLAICERLASLLRGGLDREQRE